MYNLQTSVGAGGDLSIVCVNLPCAGASPSSQLNMTGLKSEGENSAMCDDTAALGDAQIWLG